MPLYFHSLKDKVALVTGGASGLGLGIAKALVANGVNVVITDIDKANGECEAEMLQCGFIHHDVSDENAWNHVAETVNGQYQGLHILVNNAGVEGSPVSTPETASLSDWQLIHRINVEGVFLGCRAAIPIIRRSGGGAIINISSIGSLEPTPSNMAYGASKAAVRHITKSVAMHCATDGSKIRCNSIHPGVIKTAMISRLTAGRVNTSNTSLQDLLSEYLAEIPQGEFQDVNDIANTVLFLASDEARHITGIKLVVDGGLTMGGLS
mgnify:FL=1